MMKPTILLPSICKHWPEERLRVVLIHELSHIKRFDNLIQWLAGLIVSVYWFNPLVWVALRMLRIYREAACDDLVINNGILPSAYAAHLLETVRGCRLPRFGLHYSVAMASTTKIEQRMVRILDSKCNRKPILRKSLIYLTIIFICLIFPFSFFRLIAANSGENQQTIAANDPIVVPQLKFAGEQLEILIEGRKITGRIEDFPTLWPERGIRSAINSDFGSRLHPVFKEVKFHLGIDIGSPYHTPIVAMADGKVITAKFEGGYGNLVLIQHQYFDTLYAKLEKFPVKSGDTVRRGEVIGYSGSSGVATGPHLHLEIRYGSKFIDPKLFLELSK